MCCRSHSLQFYCYGRSFMLIRIYVMLQPCSAIFMNHNNSIFLPFSFRKQETYANIMQTIANFDWSLIHGCLFHQMLDWWSKTVPSLAGGKALCYHYKWSWKLCLLLYWAIHSTQLIHKTCCQLNCMPGYPDQGRNHCHESTGTWFKHLFVSDNYLTWSRVPSTIKATYI